MVYGITVGFVSQCLFCLNRGSEEARGCMYHDLLDCDPKTQAKGRENGKTGLLCAPEERHVYRGR